MFLARVVIIANLFMAVLGCLLGCGNLYVFYHRTKLYEKSFAFQLKEIQIIQCKCKCKDLFVFSLQYATQGSGHYSEGFCKVKYSSL